MMCCLTYEPRYDITPGWLKGRTRRQQDDRLVTLSYGSLSFLSANPIEQKPRYHSYSGSRALTRSSWGQNNSGDYRACRFTVPATSVGTLA